LVPKQVEEKGLADMKKGQQGELQVWEIILYPARREENQGSKG